MPLTNDLWVLQLKISFRVRPGRESIEREQVSCELYLSMLCSRFKKETTDVRNASGEYSGSAFSVGKCYVLFAILIGC